MKKSVIFVLCAMLGFMGIIKANASNCSNEELVNLKKTASKVQLKYVEEEKELDPSTYLTGEEEGDGPVYDYFFKMIFSGITDKIYVKVSNNYNDDVKFIRFKDLDSQSLYTYDWKDTDKIVKVTYEVYSSSQTSCPDEKLYTGYLVLPKYNELYETVMCDGIEQFEACHKYITEDIGVDKLQDKILKYVEEKQKQEENKDKKWYQRVGDFVADHKFLTGFSIVVIGGVATVLVVNKRKRVK